MIVYKTGTFRMIMIYCNRVTAMLIIIECAIMRKVKLGTTPCSLHQTSCQSRQQDLHLQHLKNLGRLRRLLAA